MSGGHYDYKCFRVMELCDEMERQTMDYLNPKPDQYDPGYSKEHMNLRLEFLQHMRKVAELAHTIEYTDSGDYGADREFEELKRFFKEIT